MKRVLLLLCMALSLFSGIAVADQVVSGPGVVTAQPSPQPETGSPLMAAAPPLTERICPAASLDTVSETNYASLIGTGIAAAPSPVAYDTGDPKVSTQA